jgi:CheY-like chemotaxis protein
VPLDGTVLGVVRQASAAREARGPAMTEALSGSPSPPARVVLVVDDDEATREAHAIALRRSGLRVLKAHNGQHALEQLRLCSEEDRPCCILLDLMMPVMNGWQFRAEQRRDPRLAGVPVIVCSGEGAAEQRAGSIEAAGYLNKPVDFAELLQVSQRYA